MAKKWVFLHVVWFSAHHFNSTNVFHSSVRGSISLAIKSQTMIHSNTVRFYGYITSIFVYSTHFVLLISLLLDVENAIIFI
jgi:hypothetical protein